MLRIEARRGPQRQRPAVRDESPPGSALSDHHRGPTLAAARRITTLDQTERVLYHQIHPAKLATDLTAELVSVALIWQRRYVLGLVAHLVPPIVASAVLTRRTADLERLRDTRAGRHVRSEMTPPIVALRVIDDVLTVADAWRHRPAVIAAGALLVLAGWTLGPRSRDRSS